MGEERRTRERERENERMEDAGRKKYGETYRVDSRNSDRDGSDDDSLSFFSLLFPLERGKKNVEVETQSRTLLCIICHSYKSSTYLFISIYILICL